MRKRQGLFIEGAYQHNVVMLKDLLINFTIPKGKKGLCSDEGFCCLGVAAEAASIPWEPVHIPVYEGTIIRTYNFDGMLDDGFWYSSMFERYFGSADMQRRLAAVNDASSDWAPVIALLAVEEGILGRQTLVSPMYHPESEEWLESRKILSEVGNKLHNADVLTLR